MSVDDQHKKNIAQLARAFGARPGRGGAGAFGMMACADEIEAEKICDQFRTLTGVTASQTKARVYVQPASMRTAIDTFAQSRGWNLKWCELQDEA